MENAILVLYEGPCNNLKLKGCTDTDNCGGSIMPIVSYENLKSFTTLLYSGAFKCRLDGWEFLDTGDGGRIKH